MSITNIFLATDTVRLCGNTLLIRDQPALACTRMSVSFLRSSRILHELQSPSEMRCCCCQSFDNVIETGADPAEDTSIGTDWFKGRSSTNSKSKLEAVVVGDTTDQTKNWKASDRPLKSKMRLFAKWRILRQRRFLCRSLMMKTPAAESRKAWPAFFAGW